MGATIYAYKCKSCGGSAESTIRDPALAPACSCGGVLKRDYSSVQMGISTFQPHFNHSVGMHVNNPREFSDALKIRSEEQSERTGMDHNFTRIDPGDITPTSDTDIFETRNRIIHDKGIHGEGMGLVK